MDKSAIKNFAIKSRSKLMEDVEYRMNLIGIFGDNDIKKPSSSGKGNETYQFGSIIYSIYNDDIEKREKIVQEVKHKGFKNVIEEVSFTWFNRIIAIRYMEINNYLPTKTRVLSSEIPGKLEPDIITEALDIDLNYTKEDKEKIFEYKDENKLDELFRFLFIKQCNKLNEILPGLFEKTEDYLELLLNISFTNNDGVIRLLIDTISEDDFKNQVEILGWLYQFYNSELKDETFENFKNKNIKINKEKIPAVTQLFTPDWIVKYMVENSLGRLWLEGHPNKDLKSKWKYYVEEAQQNAEVETQLNNIKNKSKINVPEDIKVIDPCMGSGHILVYFFDVLMDIYVSEGYTEKDSAELILENNLYGLDIDDRAYQFAYFAVMMKARYYNRRIFKKLIEPKIFSIKESNSISDEFVKQLVSSNQKIESTLNYIIDFYKDAKEYGSILKIKKYDFDMISDVIRNFESDNNLFKFKFLSEIDLLKNIIKQSKLLSNNFDIVVTNPPYLGKKRIDSKLSNYLDKNYKNYNVDLYLAMMKRCLDFTKKYGFCSMITQQSWMYLNSFSNIREDYLNLNILNVLHLGTNTFEEIKGEIVKSSSFVIRNVKILDYIPLFIDLINFNNTFDKENAFLSKKYKYYENFKQSDFLNISDYIFMYKISHNSLKKFMDGNLIKDNFDVKRGPSLPSTSKFLRNWYEVNSHDISINSDEFKKWNFCARNGSKIKWYLFTDEVINSNILKDISNYNTQNKIGIVWPDARFGSQLISGRIKMDFVSYESGNNLIIVDNENDLYYLLALFNSYLYELLLANIIDGQHFSPIYIKKLPYFKLNTNINKNVKKILSILKKFDSWIELSYNFESFLTKDYAKISDYYDDFKLNFGSEINEIISTEKIINEEIEKITGISNEIEFDKSRYQKSNITLNDFIKHLISYAVGCMFGRYSLDDEGLQFAGGKFNINNYNKFIPDDDNIIPVLDSEYFEDDIVGRFVEFVKTCFGQENLEENLDYIADALAKNKKPSREKIRDYLLKNFFNDHKKTYKKCPIYWQFSSGKENGFNCLIYMHRYEPSLVARIRTDYLHKTQKAIEQRIATCDNIITHSSSNTEITKATKDKNKLQKQLKETQEYDEALAHVANQNIKIDLDDGVKVNYAKFQNIEVSKEGEKTKKVNLLKKL